MAERLFTWVVPVAPCALAQVRAALDEIRADPSANSLLPLGQLPMVHFANLTLFDADPDQPQALVFESNIDGPVRNYLRTLVLVGRRGLNALFPCADGYPSAGEPDEQVVSYLARTRKRPQLYHIGHPNLSVEEIRGDQQLRRSLDHELRNNAPLRDKTPAEIVAYLRVKAGCPSVFRPLVRPWHPSWAQGAPEEPTPLEKIQWWPDKTGWRRYGRAFVLLLIAWSVETAFVLLIGRVFLMPVRESMLLLGVLIVGLVYMSSADTRLLRGILSALLIASLVTALFWWFKWDPVTGLSMRVLVSASLVAAPFVLIFSSYLHILARLKVTGPFPQLDAAAVQRLQDLINAEDRPEHSIYNHVAGLSILRPDYRGLRWLRTQLALRFLNLFYRTYFVKGKLVTIPSIHFAQWSLIDGRRLLFLTNYDGSADSYLDDFFNSLAAGVAFIWFDTQLFPRTSDPRLLKLWVRAGQTLASVRYRAPVYDGLSVGMINNNNFIRTRLLRGRGQASARRWLRRFATTPVEPSALSRLIGWLRASATDAS